MSDTKVLLQRGARATVLPPESKTATNRDFASFYEATRAPVYRAVLLRARSPDIAEDACQEAYSRALASWPRLQSHPNPTAWVAKVALNQATSWWRRQRRELASPPAHASTTDATPFDEALLAVVWRLPPRQRQVIGLRILLDLSTRETAEVMGASEGTVKATLNHALRSLRERLGPLSERTDPDA